MTIKATKPKSVQQAMARIRDYMNDPEADHSHLTAYEVEEMFISFAMAVHFIAREELIHNDRHFCLWLADKLFADFPAIAFYDENGNWTGSVANENGWVA